MRDNHIIELINNIVPEIIRIRRQFHMFPELSLEEFQTSQVICDFLDSLGIEYKKVNTGVIATLVNDKNFPTIAIRAEMDALPIQDKKICEYASKNDGVMHACGHDGIVAITLGLVKILYETRATLNCNVKFIFEPAEEIGEGAKFLIKEGALENPKVDRIIIFHLANSSALGMEIQRSISTAEICSLKIKVIGKSSHWAECNKGVDAIHVAGKAICAVRELSNNYKSKMPIVIGIGTINGGGKNNIIAETVEMQGTLRTFCLEDRNDIIRSIKEKFNIIESESGALIQFEIVPKIPPIYNDAQLVKLGAIVGESVFGKDSICISSKPFLAGDNAGFYFNQVRGVRIVFFAQKKEEVNYPLHNSKFDFNEEIIPLAIETLNGIIFEIQSHLISN
jgi:amidohydrolase